jgi:hypothetical protein
MEPAASGEPASQPTDEQAGAESSQSESPSAFLPGDFFGEHECKPGDVLSIKVKAVDPETGEKEVTFEGYEGAPKEEPADTMTAMDEQFPE